MKTTSDSFAVVAFSLPGQHFPEDDDVCATAGSYIAKELGTYLEKNRHTIPDWVKGGCREDTWIYLESQRNDVTYFYDILFFPRSRDTQSMAVRYGVKVNFLRRIFRGGPQLSSDDPIHEVLRSFGAQYDRFEVLTGREFDARY